MAEEKKEEKAREEKGGWYNIALGAIRLFVFLYMAVFAVYLYGFTLLEGLISVTGAAILFAAALIATAIENLS